MNKSIENDNNVQIKTTPINATESYTEKIQETPNIEETPEMKNDVELSNVNKPALRTEDTVIDMSLIETDISPKSIFKKKWLRQYYRRQQNQPQGYPYPPGYPPQGYPPQGYPPPGYPPPGYPPPGYPPPGYPPPGYPPPQQMGGPPPPGGQGFFGQPEAEYAGHPIPTDPELRNAFIRRVLAIVLVMLLITAIFIIAVLNTAVLHDFFRTSRIFIFVPVIGMFIASYAMACSPCSHRPPCCFFILGLTTVCMSLIAAFVTCLYRTQIVIYAVVATTAIVLVCLALACSSFDFTSWWLYIVAISVGLSIIFMIILLGMMISGFYLKPLHILILVISVILQSVVLVTELQMILGGKSIEISEEDYGLAAFMLYTSIVDIFIKMVQILGLLDN